MRSTSITSSKVILGSPATMQGASNVCPFQPAQGRLARSKLAGFTLIELLIVVAIVAILAAIAIPSYEKYVLRSHRTSAKTALFDLAGREERYYATNNTYDATLSDFGYTVDGTGAVQVPNNTNEDYYGVTIAVTAATGTTPASYVATAAPTANQSADSCGSYTLTDLGVQGNSGSDTGPSGCW